MHQFDPTLSLKENWTSGANLDFAAWEFASHEHREEFRDSGQNLRRSFWLKHERQIQVREALKVGELIALGSQGGEAELIISRIPEFTFEAHDLVIDWDHSCISALGRTFRDVRVCQATGERVTIHDLRKSGRPNQLAIIHEAWLALKTEIPGFLEMSKSTQNREIQERLKAEYPSKFPGKAKIGESTIRRHRRENPPLFD